MLPNAMHSAEAQLDVWKELIGDSQRELIAAAETCDPADVTAVARLRKRWPADLVAAALQLALARRKAADKFPDHPHLIAYPTGIEQATSQLVADHKANRYASAGCTNIIDLCCGIGGDAMSLQRTAPVLAVDHNPLRAWMCKQNADCRTSVADVTQVDIGDSAFHLDPSRRDEMQPGHRRHTYADYVPGPAFIEQLISRGNPGAVKLGPGITISDLPSAAATELEFIIEHGNLTQAVLWSGSLATHPGERTATALPERACFTGMPMAIPLAPLAAFVHTINAAIERADLIGALCNSLRMPAVHPALGLLTSDSPGDSPWLTSFEMLAHMRWRERKIKTWLDEHDAGVVEVKTRDKVVDPDIMQRNLRGSGETPYTVFVLRFDQEVRALITRRCM